MNEPVGPAIARQRLHTYLRERRETQGHTASAVARKMRWSQSKLNRIENGVVTIQPIEVKALLEFYDVQDPAEVERLMDLSEISRERRWWREEKLSQEFKDFVAFESEASGLYGYFALFIPGLLQTPEYATALSSPVIKEAVADATGMNLTEVRRKRQETLFDRLDSSRPPVLNMAVDEAVLLRPVGGAEVMAAQLDHLLAVSKRPTVHLTVVPLDLGAHGGLGGTFELLEFAGREDDDVVFIETPADDFLLTDKTKTETFRKIMDDLLSSGLSGKHATDEISRARRRLKV
ncbi:helix-turn-helix domain-containing protein [Actinoplanes sp. NPDC004185]